jgi:transposase
MAEKTYREYDHDQMFLLPPSLKDWIPTDHLAYFVSDLVDLLDLSQISSVYEKEARGYPPYNPRMMVKVLVYAYCIGVPSSRKIAKMLEENVPFRVLSANNTPDFRTLSDFRKRHLDALKGLFVQVLKLCQKAGLVKLGHVALDGTKVKANASKHKAMSYGRMNAEEERLQKEIDAILKLAEDTDAGEDVQFGPDFRGDELPDELRRRTSRLEKIRQAKAALEEEARSKAELAEAERQSENKSACASHRNRDGDKPAEADPVPPDKAQRNFTDPESRIMPAPGKSFVQGYNCQAAVDAKSQVIVAEDVTQETNDKKQLQPMLELVESNAGRKPKIVSADSGYFSESNVLYAQGKGVDPYIPPDKQKHIERLKTCAPRGRIPKGLSVNELMRRKLRTKKGRRIYGKRKEVPEPVFGQVKQGRGFRQFLLRGLRKVRCEWSLICTTNNLLKLFAAGGLALIASWSGRSFA